MIDADDTLDVGAAPKETFGAMRSDDLATWPVVLETVDQVIGRFFVGYSF
jgi:hypothetical protein